MKKLGEIDMSLRYIEHERYDILSRALSILLHKANFPLDIKAHKKNERLVFELREFEQ